MRNILNTKIELQKCLIVFETCEKGMTITNRNICDFDAIISNLKLVSISTSAIMPKKLDKFIAILEASGFNLAKESRRNCGFDGKDAPCIAVNLVFSK